MTLRDHAFTVTGGSVTQARRLEQGSDLRWEITVEPDSGAAVSVVLPATADCEAPGAICDGDGRMLSSRLELAVAGPPATDATLSGLTLSGVTLAPAFDPATTGYTADVGNGVTETTVTPTANDDGATYVVKLGGVADAGGTVSLAVGSNVITVEVTAEDGSTTRSYTATVTRAGPPLTASFHDTPEDHNGTDAFTFQLRFSEQIESLSYKTLRDHAFTVTGGSVTGARRVEQESNVRWEITVEPDGNGDASIVLPPIQDCADQGAICTDDDRPLSNRTELAVSGTGA